MIVYVFVVGLEVVRVKRKMVVWPVVILCFTMRDVAARMMMRASQ